MTTNTSFVPDPVAMTGYGTEFYAQPHSPEHVGFSFDSLEGFEAGMETLNDRGCEEVQIEFIDGDDHLARLADAATIHQCDIEFWYDNLDDLNKTQATQIIFLLDLGYSITGPGGALDRHDEVCLFEGSAADYAYDFINETSEVPEHLRNYIDYDAIARDMEINGEIVEVSPGLIVTNANEF